MSETNQEEYKSCRNCQHNMQGNALYCEECGQKYTTGRITFGQLFRDFLEEVLSLDSKIFKTLAALFIPGKLTNEYFAGRHRRYVPPIRLFFITAVVFFGLLNYLINQGADVQFGLSTFDDDLHEIAYRADFMDELEAAQDSVRERFPEQPVLEPVIDTLRNFLEDSRNDTFELDYFYLTDTWNLKDTLIKVVRGDMVRLPLDSFMTKYEIEGVLAQTFVRQQIRLQTNLDDFLGYLLGQMIWMVVLMMPILALILKLLYIRRRRYYIEHLLFSFHYHAFGFFLFSVVFLLILSPIDPSFNPWGLTIASIILVIYLFIAMRRVYKQGKLKTLIKYGTLNFLYIFVFILVISLVSVISAIVY